MNHEEAALLLAQIQAFDRRTVGDADVLAWQAALFDITLPNARAAVIEHVRTKPGVWIEPGHIRLGVKRVRQLALESTPDPLPDVDPDNVVAWRRELLRLRTEVADRAGEELAGISPVQIRQAIS